MLPAHPLSSLPLNSPFSGAPVLSSALCAKVFQRIGRWNSFLESDTYAPGKMRKRGFPPPPPTPWANPASPPGFHRLRVEKLSAGGVRTQYGPGAVQPLVLKLEPRIRHGGALGTSSCRFLTPPPRSGSEEQAPFAGGRSESRTCLQKKCFRGKLGSLRDLISFPSPNCVIICHSRGV